MVVVAICRVKAGARIARCQIQAQHAGIERIGVGDGPRLQVDMADDRAIGDALPCLSPRGAGHKGGYVQRVAGHLHLCAPAGPVLARPVGINLHSVAFGVGQIEGLADQMVRSAVHAGLTGSGIGDPLAQTGPVRQKERGMEQPRLVPVAHPGRCVAAQFQQHGVSCAIRCGFPTAPQQVQADRLFIPCAHLVDVPHHKGNAPHAQTSHVGPLSDGVRPPPLSVSPDRRRQGAASRRAPGFQAV